MADTACAEVVGKNPKSKGVYFGLDCVIVSAPE